MEKTIQTHYPGNQLSAATMLENQFLIWCHLWEDGDTDVKFITQNRYTSFIDVKISELVDKVKIVWLGNVFSCVLRRTPEENANTWWL